MEQHLVRIGNKYHIRYSAFDTPQKYQEYSTEALLELVLEKIIEGEDWLEAVRLALARWRMIDPDYFSSLEWAAVRMFSWPKYFEAEFKATRSRSCFDNAMISLMKHHMISIEDVIPYCKVFKVVVRLATDPQFSAVLHNFDFTKETLAERIVASKQVRKEIKINELEYLEQNGLIVTHESTYAAAFKCLETHQMRLIKFFLGVPGLAKYKKDGRTFWDSCNYHICPSWLRFFTKEDMKFMMVENFPDAKYFKMSYPSKILEVVKDIAVKNELSSIDMLRSMQVLGDVADKFVNQFLPPPKYPLSTMLKHGQTLRRLTKLGPAEQKPFPIGFEQHTSFPGDQLPAELLLMVCEHLDTPDLVSLFCISKAFKMFEGDMFYRCVYKKEFPMVYQGLVSQNQPILQSDFNLLNKRRANWRNGKFSVNYYNWKDFGLPRDSKTEVKAIDENWTVALNDQEIFLWNCHDQQQHTLFNRCIGMYAQVGFLDSPPDRLPNLVVGSYHHMDVFINGKKKRYFLKNTFGFDGHYKNYYCPIGRDKIMSGKAPVIWSVEHEQKVCDVSEVSTIFSAKHNACTGMIALAGGEGQKMEYTFLDKNLQVVLKLELVGQSAEHWYLRSQLHWVNEHLLAHVGYSSTWITDLRMLRPAQYCMEKTVISPFCGSLGLQIHMQKSLATVWDLTSRLWESVVVLPEDVRETAASNSRYAVFSTNQTGRLCVLDFQ